MSNDKIKLLWEGYNKLPLEIRKQLDFNSYCISVTNINK